MRRLILSVLTICIILLVAVYLFIPAKVTFSKVIVIKAKINVTNRFLMDQSKWQKWFPSDSVDKSTDSRGKNLYKNYFFSIDKQMMNAAQISIKNSKISLQSLIHMISFHGDSTAIEWRSELPKSSNPIKRLRNYIKARELQKYMSDVLSHLKNFLAKEENIYGVFIHEIISKDSTLIATKCVTTGYPSTRDIYSLVESLKKYISDERAKENNFPMLHVKQTDSTTFETMVAIPVNKYLTGNGKIFFKRFVPWKVLTAEVKGGTHTIKEAMNQMETYISDYHREAMAIPFESLVTDRSRQPDTLQWITRIYTPVR
jgi:hypothetical protein